MVFVKRQWLLAVHCILGMIEVENQFLAGWQSQR